MTLVAVSQRVDTIPDRAETRDAIDQRLSIFIASASHLPVPVPNTLQQDVLRRWLAAIQPKAVVLSGGNDLGGRPDRDQTEVALLKYAADQHLPVLGICRGMQMMASQSGATLRSVTGHVRTRHHLRGEILGYANSYHEFAIADVPHDYAVLALSEDGEIEAIRHKSLPWEGWMWHPEREPQFDQRDVRRFESLLGA